MPAVRWWAGSFTETIPAAPASCRAPSSAAWPALTRRGAEQVEPPPHHLPPHPALSPDGGEGMRRAYLESLSPVTGERAATVLGVKRAEHERGPSDGDV